MREYQVSQSDAKDACLIEIQEVYMQQCHFSRTSHLLGGNSLQCTFLRQKNVPIHTGQHAHTIELNMLLMPTETYGMDVDSGDQLSRSDA